MSCPSCCVGFSQSVPLQGQAIYDSKNQIRSDDVIVTSIDGSHRILHKQPEQTVTIENDNVHNHALPIDQQNTAPSSAFINWPSTTVMTESYKQQQTATNTTEQHSITNKHQHAD